MSAAVACAPPAAYYNAADLMEVFRNGLASEQLVPDPASGRISSAVIAGHVDKLYQANVLKRRPTLDVANDQVETNMSELVKYDTELFERLNAEYCHYEQRYRYALTQFLKLATSRNAADNTNAQAMLENAKILNLRVNSLLEIMNYLANSRVGEVNSNKTAINNHNKQINEKLDKLRKSYGYLSQENVIVKTQQESVRYTQEKNAYTSNQIAVWAALNVVALGVIFYVYRN
jgi:selenocysteine-specific translation elongation factor